MVKIENSCLLHKWEKCRVHCVRLEEFCQNEKKMICEELAQITIYLSAGRAGSGLMLSCINYRSVWGWWWCWHSSQPAHYQRQELPLQETEACHSVVTPGTFHHFSSSHINIFKCSSDRRFRVRVMEGRAGSKNVPSWGSGGKAAHINTSVKRNVWRRKIARQPISTNVKSTGNRWLTHHHHHGAF